MNIFAKIIADALQLRETYVEHTLALIDEGCTVPFIARYRKEKTGGMDEVQIGSIADWSLKLHEMEKRKQTIVKTICEQDKLTDALQLRIEGCWNAIELEDLYLPYRPKRRTRAQMAREKGLEPLATLIMKQREQDIRGRAGRFVCDGLDMDGALAGAKDIIAEQVSEDEGARNSVRSEFRRQAIIVSKVVKNKADNEESAKYSDYFDWSEPLRRCSSHRLLAMRRGEQEGILRVSITVDDEVCTDKLFRHYVRGRGECPKLVTEAVEDAYKRLLRPAIENEFAAASKVRADEEAIKVFVENLRQLLLAAPLGAKRILAIDPGFANGCKTACIDRQGNLTHHETLYPHPPKSRTTQAVQAMQRMVRDFRIEAIAIGNGMAGRETREWVDCMELGVAVYVVSEDGASIYSASRVAREEFPNEDVTVRGAVSIGRRLMDPLAELVKIDPKSIGIGQYQHDVDQGLLKRALDQTVENCVNRVGVNLNTASTSLLTYVSGLGPSLAKNITDYRAEHGAFSSREQLKKVPRLGPVAFLQCAGFLRIPDAKNPLDNSAVHPESYKVVERMAKDQGVTVASLMRDADTLKKIALNRYVTDQVGLPTLTDIVKELEKPGRDPRGEMEEFDFDASVKSMDDLQVGMILPGIVTNITNFGAFVDVGVHQDGLVHISQLADRFVSDPTTVVRLHQHVKVRIIEVDRRRNRISLSLRQTAGKE